MYVFTEKDNRKLVHATAEEQVLTHTPTLGLAVPLCVRLHQTWHQRLSQ